MEKIMHIAYAADENYAKIAGISMLSLLENNKKVEQIEIHIFDDNISEKSKSKLLSIAEKYNRKLFFYDVTEKLNELANSGVTGYDCAVNIGMTAYARLFAQDILPDFVERIIYLDCDTMVNGELLTLYKMDLKGCAIGMAYDCIRNEYKKFIKYPTDKPYYNSGVMVMDLTKWANHECTKKIWEHITHVQADYPLVDQDYINVVLSEDIYPIDIKYNFLSQEFLYSYTDILKVYHFKQEFWYEKKSFEMAKEKAEVYHFCGKSFIRPWYKNSEHPMKKKYIFYYQNSPWSDEELQHFKLSLPYKIQLFAYKYLPDFIGTTLGRVMQRIFIFINYKC